METDDFNLIIDRLNLLIHLFEKKAIVLKEVEKEEKLPNG